MIQYPKLTHLTLPSVEGAFGSLNIIRDPPKSIVTRYIPKVGDTSEITEWIDGSGDRACEAITQYPRGVNPMVDVDYGNSGSNGGAVRYRYGNSDQGMFSWNNSQTYLPYRIMDGGAFRPPITPPQDLLPLSRLPKWPTQHTTNPGASDRVISNLSQCKVDLRAVREQLIQVCAPPRALFNIETPASEPVEVKRMINDHKTQQVNTNIKLQKQYQVGLNQEPDRGVNRDKRYSTIPSKAFKNIQPCSLRDAAGGNQPLPIKKDYLTSMCTTNVSGVEQSSRIHTDKISEHRNLPIASAFANPCRPGIDINDRISARTYTHLPERRSRGSFVNSGTQVSADVR